MSTISEIKQRAKALAEKTDVNSVTPKEVGGIMYDLGSYGEHIMRNGGTLGIRKVYASIKDMEADKTNPVDLWGDPIKKGNLVVIYDGANGEHNNEVYSFLNPGWKLATNFDAGYAMKADVDAKLSELGSKQSLYPILAIGRIDEPIQVAGIGIKNERTGFYIPTNQDIYSDTIYGIEVYSTNDGKVDVYVSDGMLTDSFSEYLHESFAAKKGWNRFVFTTPINLKEGQSIGTRSNNIGYIIGGNIGMSFAEIVGGNYNWSSFKNSMLFIPLIYGSNQYKLENEIKESVDRIGSYVENPEWARVYTDAEGRVIWGIKQDGSIEWSKGIPTPIRKYVESLDLENDEEIERINQLVIGLTDTFHYESNPEWAKVVVDAEGRVVFGIKQDASTYIGKAKFLDSVKVLESFMDFFSSDNNPEWAQVTLDNEGRILEGIKNDGKKYFPKQEMFEKYNDPEGRTEMTLDAEGRIVAYRDSDGTKYENKQHTKEASFDKMNLTSANGLEIAKALEDVGFKSEFPIDFSNDEFVELPIPRVAAIVKLHVPKIPTTKTDDIEGFLEYTDKDGNYFKKAIILNAQGSSSMGYYVKNMGVDFNDDSKIKFGHWVSQDSFHIKKYYIDAFRGQCVVGYHLMEQVYQTRPLGEKKPYDYMNANDSIYGGLGKIKKDFNTGALCHPDGFPIIIYHVVDGVETYMGVYAWCLKKHRDNYYTDKSKATNIILDGTLYDQYIWGGSIDWTKFEIRNPKDLVDINGNEYDGDNPKELSDSDELSAETKGYIERISNAKSALQGNMTKEVFEQYFLVDPFIDWFLVSQVTYNIDGFGKNWIWCTWDGLHWTPTLYDADSIFGSSPIGTFIIPNSTNGILKGSMAYFLDSIYKDEIKSRYADLRRAGVFDVDNIVKLLSDWLDRIGYENLKNDLELYNETPSYRESHINENWEVVDYTWTLTDDTYNSDTSYSIGETCVYYGYLFKAVNSVKGIVPLNRVYDKAPYGMGVYNSPLRVKNWLVERISYLDKEYEYNV